MPFFFSQLVAPPPPEPTKNALFGHARGRFRIGSLDDHELGIVAQYNPRELQINQPVGWKVHEPAQGQVADEMFQEFTGAKPQTLQVELLFDFERADMPVMEQITILKKLAAVRDAYASEPELRRPHFCVATWSERGPDSAGHDPDSSHMPALRCVIESLATKYQMFSPTGLVMRATCTISLREANTLAMTKRRKLPRT